MIVSVPRGLWHSMTGEEDNTSGSGVRAFLKSAANRASNARIGGCGKGAPDVKHKCVRTYVYMGEDGLRTAEDE